MFRELIKDKNSGMQESAKSGAVIFETKNNDYIVYKVLSLDIEKLAIEAEKTSGKVPNYEEFNQYDTAVYNDGIIYTTISYLGGGSNRIDWDKNSEQDGHDYLKSFNDAKKIAKKYGKYIVTFNEKDALNGEDPYFFSKDGLKTFSMTAEEFLDS